MSELNKQIEEEANLYASVASNVSDYNTLFHSFKKGYKSCLHSSRWRKFGVDDLPKIGRQIICRDGDKYHLSKPISHDGIHWLAEHFTEWKPID